MPYAAGTFTLVAGNPVVTGTVISSTTQNNTMSDVATGLSTAVLKDGSQTTTAVVPFGTFGVSFTEGMTLKNYATGTWTPVIKFGSTVSGTTYGVNSGAYQRTGGRVDATFSIIFSSKGSVSASGFAAIQGFPIPNGIFNSVGMTDFSNMTSTLIFVAATIDGGSSAGRIVGGATVNNNLVQLRASDFADNTVLQGIISYFA